MWTSGLKNWCRGKGQMGKETEENLYMRWEQDKNLEQLTNLALFEEYLEMGELLHTGLLLRGISLLIFLPCKKYSSTYIIVS